MELNQDEMRAVVKRLKRAQGQIAAVSKALDRAGFAVIAVGLRQCITDPGGQTMDVGAMEKLFLSLA